MGEEHPQKEVMTSRETTRSSVSDMFKIWQKIWQRDQCSWSRRMKEEKQWPPEVDRDPDHVSF